MDFAIGVGKVNGKHYVKDVHNRHTESNDDSVMLFDIDSTRTLRYKGMVHESVIIPEQRRSNAGDNALQQTLAGKTNSKYISRKNLKEEIIKETGMTPQGANKVIRRGLEDGQLKPVSNNQFSIDFSKINSA